MNSPRHTEVLNLARITLARLRDEHGLVLDDDEDVLAALAEEGISIDEILSRLGRAALAADDMVEMLDARIKRLTARRDRFKSREALIRGTLLQAMQTLGLKKFRDAEFTAGVAEGKPKVIITDPDALPATCVRIKREPDKPMIRWHLDHGLVPGAELSNAESFLTIRST